VRSLLLVPLVLVFVRATSAAEPPPPLDSEVFSLTGGSNTLVSYNADTFQPSGSAALTGGRAEYDLAFDNSGRLFGLGILGTSRALLEYDPVTGAIINSSEVTGIISGIAARGGSIYSLTGGSNTLVSYNADTLQPNGNPALTGGRAEYDLAFDDSGRLFGLGVIGASYALLEYDPATGAIINSSEVAGIISGIAARGGSIYSLTGGSNTLVGYNADTLQPNGSPALTGGRAEYDLAFDDSGRLFGLGVIGASYALLEYDPATGATINASVVTGIIRGIAVQQVPEPTISSLLAVGVACLAVRCLRRFP